jgi:hypothetical protein
MRQYICVWSNIVLALGGIFLNVAAADPISMQNTFWGAETNFVKAGLYVETLHDISESASSVSIRLNPLLYNSSTNNGNVALDIMMYYLPSLESRYRMDLFDAKGNPVQKTTKGKGFEKPVIPTKPPTTGVTINTGFHRGQFTLLSREARNLPPSLMLQDYFTITNSGIYNLHFEMSVIKPDITKDTEEIIHFPPVDAEIKIELNP